MWRLTKLQMKAGSGWRKRNKQTLEQRESLWSLVSLSVTLHPSNHTAIHRQTLTDTATTHTNTHTEYNMHVQTLCHHSLKPSKIYKRVSVWQPPAALQEDEEDRQSYCVRGWSNNNGDQKSHKLTDIHGVFRLLTSTLFGEHRSEAFKSVDLTHFPYAKAWWPKVEGGMSVWVCVLSMWE